MYSVVVPGEAPSAKPKELHKSFFTRLKNGAIEFDYKDSGKTAYVAVQIENSGGKQDNGGGGGSAGRSFRIS
ncbi:MAG: hypothetical protein LBB47_01525 [Spirochaetaceae bacterium]|nr:hypothetical protein [Spirochaetaceae bacterium]